MLINLINKIKLPRLHYIKKKFIKYFNNIF